MSGLVLDTKSRLPNKDSLREFLLKFKVTDPDTWPRLVLSTVGRLIDSGYKYTDFHHVRSIIDEAVLHDKKNCADERLLTHKYFKKFMQGKLDDDDSKQVMLFGDVVTAGN